MWNDRSLARENNVFGKLLFARELEDIAQKFDVNPHSSFEAQFAAVYRDANVSNQPNLRIAKAARERCQ